MRKIKLIIALMVILISSAFSQADKLTGFWLTEEGDSQVQIFKTSIGKYCGKVVWMKEDLDATDNKNPNPKMKNQNNYGASNPP